MSFPPKLSHTSDQLVDLCQELLAERRLVLVSNRGPVEYRVAQNGELQLNRGTGGVVTTLRAISKYVEVTWIASTMGEGDRLAASGQSGRFQVALPGQRLYLRFVTSPRNVYHKYYNLFCNPLLWFLQHYMWNSPYTPNVDAKVYDAWDNGYVAVNRAFADAVIAEAAHDRTPPFIMIHDYQLYLVGGYLRQEMPNAILQHFIHIPWPASSYWQLFPDPMRRAILESLCAADIVGLQTNRDVHYFLHSCEMFLDGAKVDYESRTVVHGGRKTQIASYPVSVDLAALHRVVRSPRVQEYEEKLRLSDDPKEKRRCQNEIAEQRKLLLTMLDAVYVDAKKTKCIIAIKPKPPFKPIFQVAVTKQGSDIRILNEPYGGSTVFLVETGEAPSIPETRFFVMNAFLI